MLRSATLLACLTCSAFAQTITGTPFANLTLIRQNEANFSSNVALPSFPCDSSSSGLVGGYQPLDLDDVDLSYVSQAVLGYFVKATSNLTECDIIINGVFNTTDACSQVVRGTNYAIELDAVYSCVGADSEPDSDSASGILSYFGSLLRATVYLPLPEATSDSYGSTTFSPVIKDIWFYMPPAVLSFNISAAAPAAAPASPSSAGTTTTNLLTDDSGVGSSTGTLQFVPPAAQASPAAQSTPEPQFVTGLDVDDQEQSIASG